MLKKLAVAGASAVLLVATAVPAFAKFDGFGSKAFVNLSNNGTVNNNVTTFSNTGSNSLTSWGEDGSVENSYIGTGIANSQANVQTQLNWNQATLSLSGSKFLDLDLSNIGNVANTLYTSSNTGGNSITGHWGAEVEGSHISTGNSTSGSVVVNVVNTNKVNLTTTAPTITFP